MIVGTNALWAYEIASGVHLGSEYIATQDADLLWEARRKIELLHTEVRKFGLLAILQRADRSYSLLGKNPFTAVNRDAYAVDIIRPEDKLFFKATRPKQLSGKSNDFEPAPIFGMQWMLNAPQFRATVIAEDGLPLELITIDPRFFALHKIWLSQQPSREPLKKRRDREQARIVAHLCRKYLGLEFETKLLRALPVKVRSFLDQLKGPEHYEPLRGSRKSKA